MTSTSPYLPLRLGIFGGSFNPVHAGHVRMAVEVREAFSLDRVDLVPSARPPHKASLGMLPFELRWRLAQLAVADVPGLCVSELEAVLPGPSYTFETLRQYREILPEAELYFILGAGDLLALPQWHRGDELVEFADIVAVPRFGLGRADVLRFLPRLWPGIEPVSGGPAESWLLPCGSHVHYLETTRLEISASDIRARWTSGRSITCLVPAAVEHELRAREEQVAECWKPPLRNCRRADPAPGA